MVVKHFSTRLNGGASTLISFRTLKVNIEGQLSTERRAKQRERKIQRRERERERRGREIQERQNKSAYITLCKKD